MPKSFLFSATVTQFPDFYEKGGPDRGIPSSVKIQVSTDEELSASFDADINYDLLKDDAITNIPVKNMHCTFKVIY